MEIYCLLLKPRIWNTCWFCCEIFWPDLNGSLTETRNGISAKNFMPFHHHCSMVYSQFALRTAVFHENFLIKINEKIVQRTMPALLPSLLHDLLNNSSTNWKTWTTKSKMSSIRTKYSTSLTFILHIQLLLILSCVFLMHHYGNHLMSPLHFF